MVEAAAPRRQWLSVVPWEVVSIVLAVGLTLLLPLEKLEHFLYAEQLKLAGKSNPPRSTVAVPARVNSNCGANLAELVEQARPRLLVLLSPIPDLCPLQESSSKSIIVAHEQDFIQVGEAVVGIADESALGQAIGGGWVAPRDERAVPSLLLSDFSGGRAPPSMLEDRIAVVGLELLRSSRASTEEKAAAIGALVEDGSRAALPRTSASLLFLVLAALGAYAKKLGRFVPVGSSASWGALLLCAGALSAVLAASFVGAWGFGGLLPGVSATTCLALAMGLSLAPEARARRSAQKQAEALLASSLENKTVGLVEDDDAEFWSRLADRAEQAHPADSVLVAELPPFEWHLKVWPHGDVTEAIIKERRRDIRRTPYSDERGVPVTCVTRRYLVMQDWPAVLVPMIADEEVEGYLILVGPQAESAYQDAPERTRRVAADLAALARQRRLAQEQKQAKMGLGWEHPARLVEGTRDMLEELSLMTVLFQSAPVGLLYADSFGDVRLIGSVLFSVLADLKVPLPPTKEAGVLKPGELPLSRVLEAFGKTKSLADIAQEDVELITTDSEGHKWALVVRHLPGDEGVTSGYVAAMRSVDVQGEQGTDAELVRFPAERGDPLVVFSLAQLVVELLGDLKSQGELKLRLQTPRTHAMVVAHSSLLRRGLEQFLLDMSKRSVESAPVITLAETEGTVELSFLDVHLGVPAGAVRRALAAPSVPPPGLASLSTLTKAVEDCHGHVRVETDVDWGLTVVVELIRARPKVKPDLDAIASKSLSEVIDLLNRQ